MKPIRLLTAEEMRRAEGRVFAAGISSLETMRRAGNAVAETVLSRWPKRRVDRVLVLCGPGNNGGDGFIVAARLRREGWPVALACVTAIDRLMGDASIAAREWDHAPLPATEALASDLTHRSLVIDALFGTGLARNIKDESARLVKAINGSSAGVVAVDIASGIESDTGRIMGTAIEADVTVTFGWPKRGHLLLPGRDNSGELLIAPIGLESGLQNVAGPACCVNSPECWISGYRLPGSSDNKYSRGSVAVAGGPMMGAARLAAAGARQSGAGMAVIWDSKSADGAARVTEPGIIVSAGGIDGWKQLLGSSRATASVAGPGFEADAKAREVVLLALKSGKPTVVDGGGLSAFAQDPAKLFGSVGTNVVLTPHAGEFARLFPDLMEGSKIVRALEAARRSRSTIILKGSDTVIAAPDGQVLVADSLPGTLATAGSGDVLAGIVGALLGLGMAPIAAAGMAVWLHGAAARRSGPILSAERLAEELPTALAETVRASEIGPS